MERYDIRLFGPNAMRSPFWWLFQSANYTLTSTTSEQQAFNESANGRLQVPAGVFQFDCLLYVTSMSGSSGNLSFDPIAGAGSAGDKFGWTSAGADATTPTSAQGLGGCVNVTQQSAAPIVSSSLGTSFQMRASGLFILDTARQIVPSITLQHAAAAVVQAGSWFCIRKLAAYGITKFGQWD